MLYTDTITVYNAVPVHRPPDPPVLEYKRTVIKKAMWKDKTHYANGEGKSFIQQSVSVTIPKEADQGGKKFANPLSDPETQWTLKIEDIVAKGEAPEITAEYSLDRIRKEFKTAVIRAVSDSADQKILPMWKAAAV